MLMLAALACFAIDGDTIRCGRESVRLLGIDAPEYHCRRGRTCVPGDAGAAKRALAAEMARGRVTLVRLQRRDRYGRTLAHVLVDGRNVACAMIRGGHAQYVAKWDTDRGVARACRP